MDAAARKKENSDEQHAIFAHRVAWCIEADSGIFEHLRVL